MFYVFKEKFRKINYSLLIFYLFSLFFICIPLLLIFVHAFRVKEPNTFQEHLAFVNSLIVDSLIRSIFVSVFSMVLVILIGYSFAYFLFNVRSIISKMLIIALITSPIWSTFFVKLIGLKSFFDFWNGKTNSTNNLLYVIIGLVYIHLPTAILSFYNSISHIPKNIINSAMDLGRTKTESVFSVIIPYTNKSIITVFFLVFLPSVTAVSVPDFLNKSNGSKMVAQIISDWSSSSEGDDGIGISRMSFLVFFFIFLGVSSYLVIKNGAQLIGTLCRKRE